LFPTGNSGTGGRGGDDANPGTQAAPVATINEGMNKAVQLGLTQPVFVAEGTYLEDVALREAVDLLGGHQCAGLGNCTWERDPAKYVSLIDSQDIDGVHADPTITRETLVEGLTVRAMSGNPGGNQYSAFFLEGAPEIRANVILGGNVTGCGWPCGSRGVTVSGVPLDGLGALIAGNVIQGGSSSADTIGIEIKNGGVAEIARNDISGGTGNWTRCVSITATAGAVSIARNELHAGSCNGNSTTFAVYAGQGVSPLIRNNILLGGIGLQHYSGYEDVNVQGSSCRPQAFENNNLFGAQ
jgi:hypothetical protein